MAGAKRLVRASTVPSRPRWIGLGVATRGPVPGILTQRKKGLLLCISLSHSMLTCLPRRRRSAGPRCDPPARHPEKWSSSRLLPALPPMDD